MDLSARWLALAREDLQVADITLREGLYNQTCFHAQQAAEKAMKGFLAAVQRKIPKTHSLSEILKLCLAVEEGLKHLEPRCRTLDRYYIPTRYPDALPGSLAEGSPSFRDAEEAIQAAQEILAAVDEKAGRLP